MWLIEDWPILRHHSPLIKEMFDQEVCLAVEDPRSWPSHKSCSPGQIQTQNLWNVLWRFGGNVYANAVMVSS